MLARVQDRFQGGFSMDDRKQAEHLSGQPRRAIRLTKGIALILIAAVAIGFLVSATLALVGLH